MITCSCLLSKVDDGLPSAMSSDHICCPRAMMAYQARRIPTVYVVQGIWFHAMTDVVRPCVQTKGNDWKSRLTSSNCLCCPRMMMAWHARRHPTVCVIQGRRCHVTPNIVLPRVLPNGDEGMPRLMSSNCLTYPKSMRAFHALRRPIVCAV